MPGTMPILHLSLAASCAFIAAGQIFRQKIRLGNSLPQLPKGHITHQTQLINGLTIAGKADDKVNDFLAGV